MKIYKFIISTFVLLSVIACEDVMKQKVDFDVKVVAADYIQKTDSGYAAPVGSKITFDFVGEPDFISFEYDRFLPTNATLKFATQAAWGTHIENSMQVLISDSFEGLSFKMVYDTDSTLVPQFDFDKDSIAVASHSWTDVTSQCNLPITVALKREASLPINDYRGKKMVIAFRYKTTFADDWQPSWTVSDLKIENTRITDDSHVSTYLAATMGFTPFDILNRETAYRNETGVAGVWNTVSTAAMAIRQTPKGNALNEDWLVSKPIEVPMGLVEKGQSVSVKNMTMLANQYEFKFDNVGEYTVSFIASNYNYQHHASMEKIINILITD